MNQFKNASIGKKLVVLLIVFIVGYMTFGLVSFSTLNILRINGNLYNHIIMSKDLIADVLPPPSYIIESYLDVLQAADETDSAQIDYYLKELKRLETDYNERHQFWVNEPLLEQGALRDAMLTGAYDPAIQFFNIIFSQFIPALQKGDRESAKKLAYGDLKNLYTTHRKSVDQVVLGATEKHEKTEELAAITIQRDAKTLFIIAFAVIAAAVILSLAIRLSIIKPIVKVANTLKIVAEGDLTKSINVDSKDEVGALAHDFNFSMGKIRSLIATIKYKVSGLEHTSYELSVNMDNTSSAVQQITSNLDSMRTLMIKQENGAEESGKTLVEDTEGFIKTSQETVESMNEILKGIHLINDSIRDVDEMSHENDRNFESLKHETQKFKDTAGDEKQKLLIVDDDSIHLEMVEKSLSDEYEIFTATSGKDALSLFYQGLVPNLILLDLIMPGMDGWDTYKRIKAISNLHDIPIAFFSASTDPRDKKHAHEIGAVDFIKKPYERNDLLNRTQKILRQKKYA